MTAHPKPEPLARVRNRKRRRDQTADKVTRELVRMRDLDCRFPKEAREWWPCRGPWTRAHLGEFKRFKTRGKPPEERHRVDQSCGLCAGHHADYDAGELAITFTTHRGADDPMEFRSFRRHGGYGLKPEVIGYG